MRGKRNTVTLQLSMEINSHRGYSQSHLRRIPSNSIPMINFTFVRLLLWDSHF